jgi:16S rRNA (cytosine967-C5)-methyltransferase
MNSRYGAVHVLTRVFRDGAYSNLVLKEVKDAENINFLTAIVYGTLSYSIQLDEIIAKYNKRKIDIEVKNILRSALYQLIYMKTKDYTVVNESVKLAKDFKKTSASGFINAVLRKFISDRYFWEEKINADPGTDIEKLCFKYSVPKWLYELLLNQYGSEDTNAFLENSLLPPPLSENKEYVQDYSSYCACEALGVEDGMTVLDMCAAPGGKTFTISKMMNGTGQIISLDLREHRVGLIKETAEKLGLKNVFPRQGDASAITDLPLADRILCDVPCSGLGVIRRKPEIKLKNLPDLSEIQYAILENSSKFLKKGGELVYSTCTLNKAENEEVVKKFLDEHKDFIGIKFSEEKGEPFTSETVTILPKYFNSDGFFIAKMRKAG